MKVIYKYPLRDVLEQTMLFGKNDRILSVTEQHDQIVMYALVYPNDAKTKLVTFRVYPTGMNVGFTHDYAFLGTVKLQDGDFMFHVFYKEDD